MLAVLVVAMPLCILMLLNTFFKLGVDTGRVGGQINSFGGRAYQFLHGWLTSPRDADTGQIAAMTGGFGFTLLLGVIRSRFFGWPIHPLGYGISSSSHMFMFWAPFIISGVAKWSLLKYGGIGLYRRAIPLFLGLVLGDFVVGSFWNILSIILDTPTYVFYYYPSQPSVSCNTPRHIRMPITYENSLLLRHHSAGTNHLASNPDCADSPAVSLQMAY